ncbi:MAG TPA: ABC transporter permease [Anaerolineae bacterium]|nr:ABC transporter permease [Anaerolineae bacterium]
MAESTATLAGQPLARPTAADIEFAKRKPRTLWSDAWLKFRRHRTAMIGSAILLFFILATIFGPIVYTRSASKVDFGQTSLSPSLEHPFGTNQLGQDQLARAMYGGRISIAVGLLAMFVSITLGIFIGAMAGFFGGMIDGWLMRLTELFLALPVLPVLIMTVYLFRDPLRAAFGPQFGVLFLIVLLIGLFGWMAVARIVRASFLSLKQKEFVEAANCLGVPTHRIIFRHILPNVLSPVIVAATLAVGAAIITESTLSFLGLGFPPDFPTWGRMLFDAQDYLSISPHIALFPGLLIFLTVLSINYVGDGLRDALDPRTLGKG